MNLRIQFAFLEFSTLQFIIDDHFWCLKYVFKIISLYLLSSTSISFYSLDGANSQVALV